MPNQFPFGYMNPMDNFNNSYNINYIYKIKELEDRIKILEDKIKVLEKSKNDYGYETSMSMI